MLGAHCVTDGTDWFPIRNQACCRQTARGLCVFILWSETTQPEPTMTLTAFLIPQQGGSTSGQATRV